MRQEEIREWGTDPNHKYVVRWEEYENEEPNWITMEKGFTDKFKAQQWCDMLNESGMSPTLVTI